MAGANVDTIVIYMVSATGNVHYTYKKATDNYLSVAFFRTGYGNRTHIARLRILSTNRYTNPAFLLVPPAFFANGNAKVGIFTVNPNFY